MYLHRNNFSTDQLNAVWEKAEMYHRQYIASNDFLKTENPARSWNNQFMKIENMLSWEFDEFSGNPHPSLPEENLIPDAFRHIALGRASRETILSVERRSMEDHSLMLLETKDDERYVVYRYKANPVQDVIDTDVYSYKARQSSIGLGISDNELTRIQMLLQERGVIQPNEEIKVELKGEQKIGPAERKLGSIGKVPDKIGRKIARGLMGVDLPYGDEYWMIYKIDVAQR